MAALRLSVADEGAPGVADLIVDVAIVVAEDGHLDGSAGQGVQADLLVDLLNVSDLERWPGDAICHCIELSRCQRGSLARRVQSHQFRVA